jgi:hypothetical protein
MPGRIGMLVPGSQRSMGLAPIYAAMIMLLSAGVLGLALAFWRPHPALASCQPQAEERAATSQSADKGSDTPGGAHKLPPRGTWM